MEHRQSLVDPPVNRVHVDFEDAENATDRAVYNAAQDAENDKNMKRACYECR